MATGPNSEGIDVAAILGPLVDLGFTLAGTAKQTAEITMGGKRRVSSSGDQAAIIGGITLTVPVVPFKRRDTENSTVDAKEQSLLVNVDDLRAQAEGQGVSNTPRPRDNDSLVIAGVKWNIIEVVDYSEAVLELRARR